jgi:hypothetical protein
MGFKRTPISKVVQCCVLWILFVYVRCMLAFIALQNGTAQCSTATTTFAPLSIGLQLCSPLIHNPSLSPLRRTCPPDCFASFFSRDVNGRRCTRDYQLVRKCRARDVIWYRHPIVPARPTPAGPVISLSLSLSLSLSVAPSLPLSRSLSPHQQHQEVQQAKQATGPALSDPSPMKKGRFRIFAFAFGCPVAATRLLLLFLLMLPPFCLLRGALFQEADQVCAAAEGSGGANDNNDWEQPASVRRDLRGPVRSQTGRATPTRGRSARATHGTSQLTLLVHLREKSL